MFRNLLIVFLIILSPKLLISQIIENDEMGIPSRARYITTLLVPVVTIIGLLLVLLPLAACNGNFLWK